jgi:periplasmic protein CpxP/Spy
MHNRLICLSLGGLLAIGAAGTAMAQDNAAPGQQQGQTGRGPMRMNPDRQLERMTRELALTADQQNQIKPLLVDRQQKMEATFQDQSLSEQDRRAKMQSIRQESQGKIEAVLNDQQKQKFEAMEERPRNRRGPGQGAPQDSAPQP